MERRRMTKKERKISNFLRLMTRLNNQKDFQINIVILKEPGSPIKRFFGNVVVRRISKTYYSKVRREVEFIAPELGGLPVPGKGLVSIPIELVDQVSVSVQIKK